MSKRSGDDDGLLQSSKIISEEQEIFSDVKGSKKLLGKSKEDKLNSSVETLKTGPMTVKKNTESIKIITDDSLV